MKTIFSVRGQFRPYLGRKFLMKNRLTLKTYTYREVLLYLCLWRLINLFSWFAYNSGTRGRSCASSPCLPPWAAARSPTSMTACRKCVCGSNWRCTLWVSECQQSQWRHNIVSGESSFTFLNKTSNMDFFPATVIVMVIKRNLLAPFKAQVALQQHQITIQEDA